MSQQTSRNTPRRPRLNLPYSRRKVDVGLWAYDNRKSLLITILCFICFGVTFVTAEIEVENKDAQTEIVMDFTDLAELQEELQRAQELNDLLNAEQNKMSGNISNEVSNQMGLDEALEDHRTDARSIYEEAERVQQSLRDNASKYEAGLVDEREILNQDYKDDTPKTYRVDSSVTVSYELSAPIRHKVYLPVPSYMCEVAGVVVMDIVVNPNGQVIDCDVKRELSSSNECLRRAAREKAEVSLFNADSSAPSRQKGTITYTFVAQ